MFFLMMLNDIQVLILGMLVAFLIEYTINEFRRRELSIRDLRRGSIPPSINLAFTMILIKSGMLLMRMSLWRWRPVEFNLNLPIWLMFVIAFGSLLFIIGVILMYRVLIGDRWGHGPLIIGGVISTIYITANTYDHFYLDPRFAVK